MEDNHSMELSKNAIPSCLNNFTKDEIASKFFSTEAISNKCEKCNSFSYHNGIATCNEIY